MKPYKGPDQIIMASDKKVTETPLYRMCEYGATRTVQRTFHKGDKLHHRDVDIVIKEPTIIDIIQVYTKYDYAKGGYWHDSTFLWETARPVPPKPPQPAPPPKPPGFWARLFKRNKLPTATLVKG